LSYFRRAVVETPFVRDLGETVIPGGWVNLSGTENGKSFQQKARFADICTRAQGVGRSPSPQVTLADHP
jgi:hypothetical protein